MMQTQSAVSSSSIFGFVVERFELQFEQLNYESLTPVSIPDFYNPKELSETSKTLQPLEGIEKLENLYIFNNPKEVKSFLLTNDYLIEILLEAPKYIYRTFGKFPIYLELHHDPEEDWDELFIVIKTNYTPEKAVELEEKLFEEWFEKVLGKVNGKLNFTEEPL